MLAILGGCLALAAGMAVLLLPVLVGELSRPRDAVWGAVVLLLGLVLVTSADRLTGAPMLAVLCGGLLIGRLGSEVGLGRWRALTPEEQGRLGSSARWRDGLAQLGASLAGLLGLAGEAVGGLGAILGGRGESPGPRGQARRGGKRWVRPEPEAESTAEEVVEAQDVRIVEGFAAIDAHLNAAADVPPEANLEAPPEPPAPAEAG